MGRGGDWTVEELEIQLTDWNLASEDLVTGIDQNASRFNSNMFVKYKSLAPPHSSNNTYGDMTPKSVCGKFDELPAGLQKFRDALQYVVTSQTSSVNEENVISMAIDIHTGKCNMMDYSFREYRHEIWCDHLAFKVLRSHPKYSDEGTSTGAIVFSVTELVYEETSRAEEDLPSVTVNRGSGETPNAVKLLGAVAASA